MSMAADRQWLYGTFIHVCLFVCNSDLVNCPHYPIIRIHKRRIHERGRCVATFFLPWFVTSFCVISQQMKYLCHWSSDGSVISGAVGLEQYINRTLPHYCRTEKVRVGMTSMKEIDTTSNYKTKTASASCITCLHPSLSDMLVDSPPYSVNDILTLET